MDRVNDGGLLIALEGIDGCGKSTQAATVEAWLAPTAASAADPGQSWLPSPGDTPVTSEDEPTGDSHRAA